MGWIAKAQSSGFLSAAIMGTTAVVLASTLLTTVTHLRMHELRDSLLASNEKGDELRNLTLLSRVSMIRQRAMAGGRENAAAYKQEAESALIAIRQSRAQGRDVPLLDRATIPLLNGFNWLMGLPRLHLGKTPERELVLDLAFQFESYREYAKAIRGYDVYIHEFRLDAQESDFALLHRGFCRAMVSQFDAALSDFDAVANHSSSENADVARKLSTFLKELKARIQYIESVQDPAERGELYYNAAAYLKAIENFSQVEKNRQNDKIRFLTARALEETGNTSQALPIYRKLIASGGASPYAVNANRRMYLLGTFLGNDQDLARESKKNSETVVKDKEFMSTVTHLEKSATKLQAEAAREQSEKSDELAAVHKLVLPEEPEKIDQTLGRWLKDHLQKRRNTIRFLLPRSGSTNAFQDRDLLILTRAEMKAQEWSGQNPEYKRLHKEFESTLRENLKKRFDRFAILHRYDHQNPQQSLFSTEHLRKQGAQIPEGIEETLTNDLFVPEDFEDLVLEAASVNAPLGKLLRELQEPRPAGQDCIPWLGETAMKERILRLCARGKIAINLRNLEHLQTQAGEDEDTAWRRLRPKLSYTGRQLDEVFLMEPSAVSATGGTTPPAPQPPAGGNGGLGGDIFGGGTIPAPRCTRAAAWYSIHTSLYAGRNFRWHKQHDQTAYTSL